MDTQGDHFKFYVLYQTKSESAQRFNHRTSNQPFM